MIIWTKVSRGKWSHRVIISVATPTLRSDWVDKLNALSDDSGEDASDDEIDQDNAISTCPSICPSSDLTISKSGRVGKKRKKTSWIYNHFAVDAKGRRKCTIGRCKAIYSSSTATRTLSQHLRDKHRISSSGKELDPNRTTFSNDGSSLVVTQLFS